MGRIVRLFDPSVSVSRWDLCGALGIVAAFVVVLVVMLSSFSPHRTRLAVRPDFGLPVINDLHR